MIEITIGRAKDNTIVYDDPTVGRYHLKGKYNVNQLELEDISSSGTYINERRIKRASLRSGDQLRLGNYQVDVSQLFQKIKKIVIANKTDFTREFGDLIPHFIQYEKKKNRISEGDGKKGQIIRISITVLVLLILMLLPKESLDQTLRYGLMVGAGVLGSIFTLFSTSNARKKELLEMHQLEYEAKLVCPKCSASLIGRTLAYHRGKKACSSCDAVFFK